MSSSHPDHAARSATWTLRRTGRHVELFLPGTAPRQDSPRVAQARELARADWEALHHHGIHWITLTFGRELPEHEARWAALRRWWRRLKVGAGHHPLILFAKLDLAPVTYRAHFHLLLVGLPSHLVPTLPDLWARALRWQSAAEGAMVPQVSTEEIDNEEALAARRNYLLKCDICPNSSTGEVPEVQEGGDTSLEGLAACNELRTCPWSKTYAISRLVGSPQRLSEVSGLSASGHWRTWRHHAGQLPVRVEEWNIELTEEALSSILTRFFRRAVPRLRLAKNQRLRAWFDQPHGITAEAVVQSILAIAHNTTNLPTAERLLDWIGADAVLSRHLDRIVRQPTLPKHPKTSRPRRNKFRIGRPTTPGIAELTRGRQTGGVRIAGLSEQTWRDPIVGPTTRVPDLIALETPSSLDAGDPSTHPGTRIPSIPLRRNGQMVGSPWYEQPTTLLVRKTDSRHSLQSPGREPFPKRQPLAPDSGESPEPLGYALDDRRPIRPPASSHTAAQRLFDPRFSSTDPVRKTDDDAFDGVHQLGSNTSVASDDSEMLIPRFHYQAALEHLDRKDDPTRKEQTMFAHQITQGPQVPPISGELEDAKAWLESAATSTRSEPSEPFPFLQKARLARRLHQIKANHLWSAYDFQSWRDFVEQIDRRGHLFTGHPKGDGTPCGGPVKQANRYVNAYRIWIADLGFPFDALAELGPSTLGEACSHLRDTEDLAERRARAERILMALRDGKSARALKPEDYS